MKWQNTRRNEPQSTHHRAQLLQTVEEPIETEQEANGNLRDSPIRTSHPKNDLATGDLKE
jgi:hypothetical protein